MVSRGVITSNQLVVMQLLMNGKTSVGVFSTILMVNQIMCLLCFFCGRPSNEDSYKCVNGIGF